MSSSMSGLELKRSRRLALLVLGLMGAACAQESARTSTQPPPADGYDYIVVGAGVAGAPLAARLARANKRVLLLEAGGDVGDSPRYQVPAMHALATEDPAMAWWYFVGHHAEPGLDERDSKHTPEGILYPRGTGLGGSAAVNAMVTVLPSPSDWNRLATLTGDASWRANAMIRPYERVRQWLNVELPDPTLVAGDAVIQSMLAGAAAVHAGEHLGTTLNPADLLGTAGALGSVLSADPNETLLHAEATGLFRIPLATKDGRRFGPRERILDTVAGGYPLEVVTGALVTRVLFEPGSQPPRAIGVEYLPQPGVYGASLEPKAALAAPQQVFTRGEVILSAGAFNSPQLLMLSGIGDPEQLALHGIEARVALPGVGRNLQDRYEAAVVSEVNRPLDVLAGCRLGETGVEDACLEQWQRGQGVYTTPGFLATLLTKSPGSPLADLQIFAVPTDVRGYYPGYSQDSARSRNRFSWVILKGHTQNRDGWVRLRDASPLSTPRIQFNSYDEGQPMADPDLAAMVHAVGLVRKMHGESAEVLPDDVSMQEVWPGSEVQSDADIGAFIRRESWGHHACCTNAIGTDGDPMAVLDARLRVRGTAGLRVVDASVFPVIPGTFIAMPIYMVAEKAAAMFLEDRP